MIPDMPVFIVGGGGGGLFSGKISGFSLTSRSEDMVASGEVNDSRSGDRTPKCILNPSRTNKKD